MVVLAKEKKSIDMRKVYAPTLIDMAKNDPRVVAVDADLVVPVGMTDFGKEFPNRLIDCGIMEANAAGVAAGLSARGCIPFAHTFACFQSRKAIDQIYLTAGFADLNVKYVGTDPGVLAVHNGGSHMALEDMGVLMNVPNLTLIEITDPTMLESVLRQVKDTYGLHYLRMNRKNANVVYDPETRFEIGKGLVLREGKDVTLIASGIEVEESLAAAELLAEEGIEARVIDMFTWQPIDEDLIVESAEKTGAIVVAENHRKATGLGSAVARVLVAKCPTPMGQIGVDQIYGEVGTQSYLMEKFGLTKNHIVEEAKKTIARKK